MKKLNILYYSQIKIRSSSFYFVFRVGAYFFLGFKQKNFFENLQG